MMPIVMLGTGQGWFIVTEIGLLLGWKYLEI